MKRFVCMRCGLEWFSAGRTDAPCAECGGALREAEAAGRQE